MANFNSFYHFSFERYEVYQEFAYYNISQEIVDQKLRVVTNYISDGKATLDEDFFSKEDIHHLTDVRNILLNLYVATIIIFSLFIISLRNTKNYYILITKWIIASKLFLVVLLLFTVISFAYFDKIFILSHKLVFSNDYWLLDPKTSNIIKMFPQGIFFEVFIIVMICVILTQVAIYLISNSIYGSLNHER